MSDAVTIAVVSGIVSLSVAVIPKLIDNHYGNGKKIQQMAEDIEDLRADMRMVTDVIYTILKHLATNNNTGNIQRCLDDYYKYHVNK